MPGPRKKRKRVDNVSPISERQPANSSVRESEKASSINCVGCNGKSCLRPFSEPSLYSHGQLIFSRDATKTNSVFVFKNKGDSDGRLQETSKQVTAKSRKRFRPFSWQRRRNRRQINFEEPTPSRTACTVKDGLHGRLQYDFNNRVRLQRLFSWKKLRDDFDFWLKIIFNITFCKYATTVLSYLLYYNTGKTCLNMSSYLYSNGLIGIFLSLFHLLNIVLRLLIVIYLQMQEKCPCCLILQAPLLVTKGNHIDRHSIFYSLEYSSTVLPRKRIL